LSHVDEEQRERLHENVRPVMRRVMMARAAVYFELPQSEQMAYLDRMKACLESTDPADRARVQEFHKAMRERMEQRGITPPVRGPR
jgi:hypothetical protein